jgi:hypothetical protein
MIYISKGIEYMGHLFLLTEFQIIYTVHMF